MITYSLSIFDMCLPPHVVQKVYKKTSVGVTHRDHEKEFNRKNHAIRTKINRGPHMAK
jgi:hypothetical protein